MPSEDISTDLAAQFKTLCAMLDAATEPITTDTFDKAIAWVTKHRAGTLSVDEQEDFIRLLSRASRQSIAEVRLRLGLASASPNGRAPKRAIVADFTPLIPKKGLFADYMKYTSQTESPDAFHFFSFAVALAASLQRHVFIQKGMFKVWPGMAVMLVGPTGIVRKTSATLPLLDLLREAGTCNILPQRVTPEALIKKLQDNAKGGDATGLIYAPEFANFLGKQMYMEGMVTMLTDLFDARNHVDVSTIARKDEVIKNVCVSMLACSTPDWLIDQIPKSAHGGGFMARIIFVAQEWSEKVYTFPPPPPRDMRAQLITGLSRISTYSGEIILERHAVTWFDEWYKKHRFTVPIFKEFAGYHERKPEYVLRLAMVIAASYLPSTLTVSRESLQHAEKVLTWNEQFFPIIFESKRSLRGEERNTVYSAILGAGGRIEHSRLLRRVSDQLTSRQLNEHIQTLIEERIVAVSHNTFGRIYTLRRTLEDD